MRKGRAGLPLCNSVYPVVIAFCRNLLTLAVGTLLLAGTAFAQPMSRGIMSPPTNVRPPGLQHVGIKQNLNEQIPADLIFTDDSGRQVRLGDYFGKKPMILNLVYFTCPMLCGEELNGLESALRVLKFDVGKEFDVITVSFDPKDTPEAAAKKKAEILKRYKRAGADQGWHFLVGNQDAIDRDRQGLRLRIPNTTPGPSSSRTPPPSWC